MEEHKKKMVPKNHQPLPSHASKIYDGIRWKVHQWEQPQFDGTVKTYEALSVHDGVIVYPVIGDKVIIIEEEQPHWGRTSPSIVAGGRESDEDIVEAAKRELLEETGMTFKDFYLVGIEQRSKDIHSNTYVFVAHNHLESKDPEPDSGERTIPKLVTFDELLQMNRRREFFYKPSFFDEYIIQDKIDVFFDILKNPWNHSIDID